VAVLPAETGNQDDQVYYVVRRTINGSTVRYLEKWAQEIDCRGGSLSYLADSHITYSGTSTTTITGLSHLEGETVAVWAGGADLGTYTVSGGQITGLSSSVTSAVVGLPYTATFKSTKLGPLFKRRAPNRIGLMLADLHPQSLQYGPDLDNLDTLPLIENGTTVGSATLTVRDHESIEFPGTWSADSRVCLQVTAPRPCTVMALVMDTE
jgi:hypothetical protein